MIDHVWFERSAAEYERASAGSAFPFSWGSVFACDDRQGGAVIDRHYVHADLWAARGVIARREVTPHLDVGSRLDGMVTHILAAGRRVHHVDIRQPPVTIDRLTFFRDDMRDLRSFADGAYDTVSCIHAAEHAGLGRYGDEIDAEGMTKCMRSLARVLASGGRLYFAVPIGIHRVVFNAHRIVSPRWLVETFESAGLRCEDFSAVNDKGEWCPIAGMGEFETAMYSLGCFEMRRTW